MVVSTALRRALLPPRTLSRRTTHGTPLLTRTSIIPTASRPPLCSPRMTLSTQPYNQLLYTPLAEYDVSHCSSHSSNDWNCNSY